jgi:Tfp pilus assembly protein PilZ
VDLNRERRIYRRFGYEADISHDLLAHNHIYKGRLCNFSKGGLYFESDQSIFPGEEVFIKFQNQPDSINDDVMAQLPFGVKIVWQNDLPDALFRFGYGAHYIDKNDSLVKTIKIPELQPQHLAPKTLDAEKDPREYPRTPYHKTIRLNYKDKYYRAEFSNISRGGVFIKTNIQFPVGKPIRIAMPGSKIRNDFYLKGLIVRINTDGFGVKFDKSFDHGIGVNLYQERRTGMDRRAKFERRVGDLNH